MNDSIASGFEFQPQADGTVIIEFFDDDGNTSTPRSSPAAFRISLVAFVTTTTMELGAEVAQETRPHHAGSGGGGRRWKIIKPTSPFKLC